MCDNFSFRMSSEGDLKPIIELVMQHSGRQKISGYAVRPYENEYKPERLIFYWSTSSKTDFKSMPFVIDANMASEIATKWLEQTAKYSDQPDHDGDNERGWTVYNEAWGHVDGEWQAFVAISPAWMMYGK